jgi:succinate dehydrogenase flavin-adding protein (antitoxin of CptAB toxin-antitoxin module)
MSSDEEKYFNIPTDRTVEDLRKLLEKRYPDILKLILKKKKIIKNFGLFQKIKKNQD